MQDIRMQYKDDGNGIKNNLFEVKKILDGEQKRNHCKIIKYTLPYIHKMHATSEPMKKANKSGISHWAISSINIGLCAKHIVAGISGSERVWE